MIAHRRDICAGKNNQALQSQKASMHQLEKKIKALEDMPKSQLVQYQLQQYQKALNRLKASVKK